MGVLNLTPECFVDLVLLGLYWEHWPPKIRASSKGMPFLQDGWTTIDHVLKLAVRMEVVTQQQVIGLVQHKIYGVPHQRKLAYHCGSTAGGEEGRFLFLLRESTFTGSTNRTRLVRNMRIQLTSLGAEIAQTREQKYEQFSRERYLQEAKTVNDMFTTEKASACASNVYRRRVASDLGEKQ
ncbi:MAG: hypothetical protein JWN18_134 [Parcubacteria group bacterium]|nr:hypothetical protein [Parcubacteria group bacterium]